MRKVNRHSLLSENQKGSALILILMVTTVLLILGTVTLNISAKTRDTGELEEKKTQALYVAESAIYKNMGEIKAAILTYLEAKADNPLTDFSRYTIPNTPLNGGTYTLTVNLAKAETNEFIAEAVGYVKSSSGLDVKKTITMKFIPQDSDGTDVPNELPRNPGTGSGTPQVADVFSKYAVYSDGILRLRNNNAVVTGDVTTNSQIILHASSSIYGKAFLGSPAVTVTYENQAKITGGTQLISPPVSIPPVSDVTKLKPLLSVGGTSGSGSEITSNKIIENKTFSGDITVEGKNNVRFNNCKFTGNILFRNGSYKIEFNNCVFEQKLTINDSAVLNNCIIRELSTSNTKELYVSGLVWLERTVDINGPSIYTPTTSPLTLSPNIPLHGAGVIISENKIFLTNTVKANYSGQTNIGLVSLYANLSENDPAISNNDGDINGVLFAPNGAIKQINSKANVNGSVVGRLVSLQDSKVTLSAISPKLAELLPGTTISGVGGGTPVIPTIAGVKVTDWKED